MTIFNSFRITNGLFVKGQYRPIFMVIINIILSLILVKPFGLDGVLVATIIARILTEVWFEPYLIYKYIFEKKLSDYWKRFFKYMFTTIFVCILSSIIINFITIENAILKLLINGGITIVLTCIAIYLIYHQKDEFNYFMQLTKFYIKKISKKVRGERKVECSK